MSESQLQALMDYIDMRLMWHEYGGTKKYPNLVAEFEEAKKRLHDELVENNDN